jgi:hypothetical protein
MQAEITQDRPNFGKAGGRGVVGHSSVMNIALVSSYLTN